MVYTDMVSQNITSISGLFVYVSQAVPIFIPLLLMSLFVIVSLGSFFAQRRLTGTGNFWGSFAVAGYFIAVVSGVMSLIPNLINSFVVVICIVIAVIGTAMLIHSGD
jgi:hypothetical protein